MPIQITARPSARIRSSPSTLNNNNVTGSLPYGTIVPADQAIDPDWWSLTDQLGYVHHSVASLYSPPPPLESLSYIPYFSQEDVDARRRPDDCGPACEKMVLAWHGIRVKIDEIAAGGALGFTSGQDLADSIESYGLLASTNNLDLVTPPQFGDICLVWYGAFNRNDVFNKRFTGLHWVVYLWEDVDPSHGVQSVVVHDPDFYGDARNWGAYHRFASTDWIKAFHQHDDARRIVRIG